MADYTVRRSWAPSRVRAAAAVALFGACCLLSCAEPETAPATPVAPPPRPNVIVILVDTLRADALGAYGYERPTSPRFDALAAESVLFLAARAQASCTYPSANSLLTGLYPSHFLAQPEERMGIPPETPSIAEHLKAASYATAAVSASPIVRRSPTRFNPQGGFERGFDHFDESCLWKDAGCVNRRARALLQDLPEPFFLYLHYMEPHSPYDPPKAWERLFAGAGEGLPERVRDGDGNYLPEIVYQGAGPSAVDPAELAHLRDLYDDEVRYFDSRLGILLDIFERRGLLDRSILALVGDHGEEFLEHGHVKHCQTLYDTEIRTPFLLRLPPDLTVRPATEIRSPVGNVDLVPTLVDYLELDLGAHALEGTSLRPLIEHGAPAPATTFASWAGSYAATGQRYKLIMDLESGAISLFDLETDPGETIDVAAERPAAVRALRRELTRWARATDASARNAAEEQRDALDTLRTLGYIQ